MSHSTRFGGDNVSRTLARDRLGVASVVFFVLSAATPLTVIAGVITTGYAITGVTGLPLAFLAIAIVLAIFSVGYVAMSRHIANAGAFYTYIAHGLGKSAGVGAAWVAVVAYNALQIALYGIIGVAAQPKLEQWFDISPDWWVVALVAWAVVGILGLLRVDVNSRVLAVLLLSEIALIMVYNYADLANPAGGEISFDTLSPANFFQDGIGAILVLAVLGFIGFESSVVFSEESRNPRRTVKVATYVAIASIGFVYFLSAWAMSVATGPDNIVTTTQEEGAGTIFALAGQYLGDTWVDIGEVLFVTSVLAAMIAFHNTCGRYLFALGRERVLPGIFGRTSPRSSAPIVGSLFQTLVGLAVIVYYARSDLDPVLQLFFYGGAFGGFGVLLLIAITSFAVIAFFARRPYHETTWTRVIAPTLAALALGIVVYLAVANFDILLGVAPDNNLRWILPAVFPVVAALGAVWAQVLKFQRPEVYANIGLGANAATGRSIIAAALEEPATVRADEMPERTGGPF